MACIHSIWIQWKKPGPLTRFPEELEFPFVDSYVYLSTSLSRFLLKSKRLGAQGNIARGKNILTSTHTHKHTHM